MHCQVVEQQGQQQPAKESISDAAAATATAKAMMAMTLLLLLLPSWQQHLLAMAVGTFWLMVYLWHLSALESI